MNSAELLAALKNDAKPNFLQYVLVQLEADAATDAKANVYRTIRENMESTYKLKPFGGFLPLRKLSERMNNSQEALSHETEGAVYGGGSSSSSSNGSVSAAFDAVNARRIEAGIPAITDDDLKEVEAIGEEDDDVDDAGGDSVASPAKERKLDESQESAML
jgi:hypothetical protein